MFRQKRSGQSTLEYVIIFAVVIGAIVLVSTTIRSRLRTSYNTLSSRMQGAIGKVKFK